MNKVYLIGAGPGDGDLVTIRAVKILNKADVVVYDRLVGVEVFEHINENAKYIYVGKEKGRHSINQDEINKILYEEALKNEVVVRLKGGDPFVFGRGAEEMQYLNDRNIDVEVVAGLCSALSVPLNNAIPLTHRDISSSIHIVTAHKKNNLDNNINYKALKKAGGSLVFLMGISSVLDIKKGLIDAGFEKTTPVAILENGCSSKERRYITNINDMDIIVTSKNIKAPALIVVGKVCDIRLKLKKDAKKCKVLITRPKRQDDILKSLLKQNGIDFISCPTIKCKKLDIDKKYIRELNNYDVIGFTSPFGVEAFFDEFKQSNKDIRSLYKLKFAVIGSATYDALYKLGIKADIIPDKYDTYSLACELKKSVNINTKIIFFRSKKGSRILIDELKQYNVTDVSIYDTLINDNYPFVDISDIDIITFTSSSTVVGFVNKFKIDYSKYKAVCIGESTAKVAKKYGFKVYVAKKANMNFLVELILNINSGVYNG